MLLLADHFLAQLRAKYGIANLALSDAARQGLRNHDWPGNVRELENAIERAFILCTDGLIEPRHLPDELTARVREPGAPPGIHAAHEVLDRQAIRAAIDANGGNRAAAAKALGIHKTTLFRRIRKLRLDLPERDGRSRRRQAFPS